MVRTALQPRWLALLGVVLVVCVGFGWLGLWQLEVARDRAAAPTTGASGPRRPVDPVAAVPLAEVLQPQQPFPTAALGRPVDARGTYDPARQVLVEGRVLRGRTGWWVVAALRTADGAWLPVVRGWVPRQDDPAAAPERGPVGAVQVRGLLRPDDAPVEGPPPPTGVLTSLDAAQLVNRWGSPIYNGFLVAQTEQVAGSYAGPSQGTPISTTLQRVPAPTGAAEEVASAVDRSTGQRLAWRNAAYAVQWWVFAGFALLLWWKMVRQDGRERAAREQQEVPG